MSQARTMTKKNEQGNEYDAFLHERACAMMGYQLAFKHKLELGGSKLGFDRWSLASVERKKKRHKHMEVGRNMHTLDRLRLAPKEVR